MDVAFAQLPMHTTNHISVLEMVPSCALMLTVLAGKTVSVSVPRRRFHNFSAYKVMFLTFFVHMVRNCQIISILNCSP